MRVVNLFINREFQGKALIIYDNEDIYRTLLFYHKGKVLFIKALLPNLDLFDINNIGLLSFRTRCIEWDKYLISNSPVEDWNLQSITN